MRIVPIRERKRFFAPVLTVSNRYCFVIINCVGIQAGFFQRIYKTNLGIYFRKLCLQNRMAFPEVGRD